MLTIPDAIEIGFNIYQGSKIKRHPILPARLYVKDGRDIDITAAMLAEMAENLKIRRPVTIAHPDLDGAEAVGWIVPGTAEVSAFGDGQALYVGIEWSKQAAEAIEARRYGYISPVFQPAGEDEAGKPVGARLLAAGLTNSPHWSEDQPELWAQFSASINNFIPASAGQTEEKEMDNDLKQAQARVGELEAELVKMTADRDKQATDLGEATKRETETAEKLTAATTKVEQFTAAGSDQDKALVALTATTTALETEVKQLKGNALLKRHESKLRPMHLVDKDGKDTPLKAAAFSDPAQFEFMVTLIPDVPLNTAAVGTDSDSADHQPTASQQAQLHAFAGSQKGEGTYQELYFAKLDELGAKENLNV